MSRLSRGFVLRCLLVGLVYTVLGFGASSALAQADITVFSPAPNTAIASPVSVYVSFGNGYAPNAATLYDNADQPFDTTSTFTTVNHPTYGMCFVATLRVPLGLTSGTITVTGWKSVQDQPGPPPTFKYVTTSTNVEGLSNH